MRSTACGNWHLQAGTGHRVGMGHLQVNAGACSWGQAVAGEHRGLQVAAPCCPHRPPAGLMIGQAQERTSVPSPPRASLGGSHLGTRRPTLAEQRPQELRQRVQVRVVHGPAGGLRSAAQRAALSPPSASSMPRLKFASAERQLRDSRGAPGCRGGEPLNRSPLLFLRSVSADTPAARHPQQAPPPTVLRMQHPSWAPPCSTARPTGQPTALPSQDHQCHVMPAEGA